MFNKALLLKSASSANEYLLTPGTITKTSGTREDGYYPLNNVGSLSPASINGKKIFKLSGAAVVLNSRKLVSLYCLLELSEDYQTSPAYFGLVGVQQFTFKLNPYAPSINARGWYATEADKTSQRWQQMYVLVGTLQELALRGEVGPFYLSTTPPAWGYTE